MCTLTYSNLLKLLCSGEYIHRTCFIMYRRPPIIQVTNYEKILAIYYGKYS